MDWKKLLACMLAFLLAFSLTLPAFAQLSFSITKDSIQYSNGQASFEALLSGETEDEAANQSVSFAVYDSEENLVDVISPITSGNDYFSVTDGVYNFGLHGIEFNQPESGSVSYAVYASVYGEVVGFDTITPGDSKELTMFSLQNAADETDSVTAGVYGTGITAEITEDFMQANKVVIFEYTGSYVKVNNNVVQSGDEIILADEDEDSEIDPITIEVFAENNTSTTYTLNVSILDENVDEQEEDDQDEDVQDEDDDSNGGTTGSGNGGSTTTTPTTPTTSNSTITAPTPTLDASSGAASVTISADELNNAVSQARFNANGIKAINIVIPAVSGATAYRPGIPASFVTADTANQALTHTISLKTDIAELVIPSNMINASEIAGTENVTFDIAMVNPSSLSAELSAQIGHRPVIDLSLMAGNRAVAWNNLNAPVTISVPYAPTAAELNHPEHIVIWYIDGNGKIVAVPSGRYNPATGKITFQTTHFSKYAVAYVNKTFNDTDSHAWAKNSIEVMASKGVINGTSETTYSPAANVTRADFMVLLVKALGLATVVDSNFADVKSSDYYYEALAVAKKLGIAQGTGENKFNPTAQISRQDMMTLINRAMKVANKNLTTGTAADLEKFTDKSLVAAYASESIATLVNNGIVTGSGSMVNPVGNATRAETAVLVYRIYNK